MRAQSHKTAGHKQQDLSLPASSVQRGYKPDFPVTPPLGFDAFPRVAHRGQGKGSLRFRFIVRGYGKGYRERRWIGGGMWEGHTLCRYQSPHACNAFSLQVP